MEWTGKRKKKKDIGNRKNLYIKKNNNNKKKTILTEFFFRFSQQGESKVWANVIIFKVVQGKTL